MGRHDCIKGIVWADYSHAYYRFSYRRANGTLNMKGIEMEDHLTWDEQLEKGNYRVMPCICFKAGYEGTLDIQDVIHPDEYREGESSRY